VGTISGGEHHSQAGWRQLVCDTAGKAMVATFACLQREHQPAIRLLANLPGAGAAKPMLGQARLTTWAKVWHAHMAATTPAAIQLLPRHQHILASPCIAGQ